MHSDEEDTAEGIHIIDMDEDEDGIEIDTWYVTLAELQQTTTILVRTPKFEICAPDADSRIHGTPLEPLYVPSRDHFAKIPNFFQSNH